MRRQLALDELAIPFKFSVLSPGLDDGDKMDEMYVHDRSRQIGNRQQRFKQLSRSNAQKLTD